VQILADLALFIQYDFQHSIIPSMRYTPLVFKCIAIADQHGQQQVGCQIITHR
jgi:hypothetical protein